MFKKSLQFLLLLTVMIAPWAAKGQETLTVCTGTTTTSTNTPIRTGSGSQSEFIYPASMLEDMTGGTITSVKFFSSSTTTTNYTNKVTVYVQEVAGTTETTSAWQYNQNTATKVYEGTTLSVTNGELVITFSTPYEYQGGNLCFNIWCVTSAPSVSYYYKETANSCGYDWYITPPVSNPYSVGAYLPRAEFTYTAPVGGCNKPDAITASSITANSATLTWNGGSGTYNVEYKKASDAEWTAVLTGTTLTTSPINELTQNTAYEARVQSVCDGDPATSVWKTVSFTTPMFITYTGFFEDFESYSAVSYSTAGTMPPMWNSIYTGTSSSYNVKVCNYSNYAPTGSGKYLFMSAGTSAPTGSPNYAIMPSIANTYNNLSVEFDYKFSATSSVLTLGYMTDKADATTFHEIENVTASTTKAHYTKSLSGLDIPAGAYLAWRFSETTGTYKYVGIDNLLIKDVTTYINPPTNPVVSAITTNSATFSWDANGETAWKVQYSSDNQTTWSAAVDVNTNSCNLTLEPATTYYARVCAVKGGNTSSWCMSDRFDTDCLPIEIEFAGWTEDFNSYTAQYTSTAGIMPDCWSSIYKGTSAGYNVKVCKSTTYAPDGSSNYLFMVASSSATYGSPNYGILPKFANSSDNLSVEFDYKMGNDYGTLTFGYMTNKTDESTFTEIEGVTHSKTKAHYAKSLNGLNIPDNVYLAFRFSETTTNSPYLGIDNVFVKDVTAFINPPTNPVISSITSTNASFSWDANGETAWKVQYSSDNQTTWSTAVDVNTNSCTLTLEPATTYYARVCAVKGGNTSSWCVSESFHTNCEAITTFPWSEKFESYPANTSTSYDETYKFDDICWLNERVAEGTGSYGSMYWFQICSNAQGGNSTNKMQLPDMKDGTMTELRLPEMTLPNDNYEFVLDMYRTSETATEGIRVFASTDGEITGATELAFISHNYSTSDGNLIPAESTSGWYTYELPIDFSGTCYIILRGESKYSHASYMDNFFVKQIPTCKTPSAFTLNTSSSKTAHTATLKWNNGSTDQDAWQIAYSTEADFDPSTVTPVDVTTNPATISGLTANTQYYAYVRANCGGGDFSDWCTTKASFQTTVGNAAPTGLACPAATLASRTAVINWTGVATNDNHASYDLYYDLATVTAVPDEPAAPNLITGITEATKTLTGLTPETAYKVWVRDNCGSDGYSAWTSPVTFTTLVACQVPTGLAVSEIQPTSAKVTWNGDASGYNLRYRTTDAPTTATVILTAGDVWGDGSGYQMILDADANQYGVAFDPDNYEWNITDYSDFEYLIPTNADFDDSSTNVVFENSVSIQIPAGIYDWYITNPSAGYMVYVASSNGNVGGSYDNYEFEAGKTYEFVLSIYGSYDGVDVTITGGAKLDEPKEVAWIVIEDVTSPYTLPGLTEEINYEVQVQAVCGGEDGESAWSSSYNFATPSACDKPINLAASALHESASLSWTGYQTNYNVQYRTAEIPAHQEKLFFEDFEDGIPNTWTILTEGTAPNANGWVTATDGGSTVAVSYSYAGGTNYNADNWLITPQINLQGSLKFKVRDNDDSTWNDEFEVLLSTTGTAKADFTTTLRDMQSPSKTLTEIDPIDLSSYAGQQGYIAIHHLSSGQYHIIVDDFGIYGAEIPTVPAGGWISRNNVTSPCEITGLTADTDYEWHVQGICKGATTTEWSEGAFTTIDDNTKIFTTAGNWDVAGNWDGGIPTIANDAIIRANVTIPSGVVATAKAVTIEGTPAPTITIKDGGQLKTNTAGLTVTVEKTIAGYGTGNGMWRFVSTPLNVDTDPTTVENMLPTNVQSTEYDLFKFDATQVGAEWQNYKQNVFNLVRGNGYLYANTATKTLQFTGTTWASNNSRLTMTITYDGSSTNPFNGWILVGNTFVCNGYLVYTDSDVTSVQEANFYTMNINGDGYALSETAVGLTPCEGALISITSETSGKLAYFTENPLSSKAKTGILNIYLAQNGKTEDMARIRFGEGYNLGHMSFKDGISTIYIPQDDKDYAVVYTESEGEMPLNFKAETTGKYNISFKLDGVNVGYLHLIDKITGEDINLLVNPEYSFIGSPRDNENRFIIRFSESSFNETFAYQNGSDIVVNGEGELQVFDVMGRLIATQHINGVQTVNVSTTGVYIFKLNEKTQKIVVR